HGREPQDRLIDPAKGVSMTRCEQGYVCAVCGQEVEDLSQSALYLQLLLGEVPPEELLRHPECHIRCLPAVAQYIVDPLFPPVVCKGAFAKEHLDPDFVRSEQERITAAWRQLYQYAQAGGSVPALIVAARGHLPHSKDVTLAPSHPPGNRE
ncbi:MAG: hypothetical protein NZ703_08455, partial [Gemmataceae bacterium]|nr:hypothetical protein [Gemmataceae bacterium]